MDPTMQSLHYLKPPTSSPKAQRDYIAIRSLSYQKNVSEAKLQENCKNSKLPFLIFLFSLPNH